MINEITLDQLLASRDIRSQRQKNLLEEYENASLVCLTVIMPGKVKRNFYSLSIAEEAKKSLLQAFPKEKISYFEEFDLPTGYEAYLVVNLSEDEIKPLLCRIEETHPLGRLFDCDVIKKDGSPMSRSEIGMKQRRCILCDNDARYCMRQHSHTTEELLQVIEQMVITYQARQSS